MNRREFLKSAGIGSATLASLSGIQVESALAGQDERRHYTFVAISEADTVDGVIHRMAMEGAGKFNVTGGTVKGGGSFVHFDNAPPNPKPIIAFGTWKARDILSYTPLDPPGVYGRIEASILEILADLFPEGAGVVKDVTLRLICNIGVAGLMTGEPEGFKLTIPGAPFGSFDPLVPAVGLTHISIEQSD